MVLDLIRRGMVGLVPGSSPVRYLTALIQVPKVPDGIVDTGPRRVLNEFFITPSGKNETIIADKADVEKTAEAMMRMLRIDHNPNDYEIVSIKPGHSVRKYFVVWFPKADEFDSWAFKFEPRIKLLQPTMTAQHTAIRLAGEQRRGKGLL